MQNVMCGGTPTIEAAPRYVGKCRAIVKDYLLDCAKTLIDIHLPGGKLFQTQSELQLSRLNQNILH